MVFRSPNQRSAIRSLPLLPLRDLVVLPFAPISFIVGRQKSIAAMQAAQQGDKEIFLAAQRQPETSEPAEEDVHTMGTIAVVVQVIRLPDNTQRVLVEGKRRGRLLRLTPEGACTMAEVEEVIENNAAGAAEGALKATKQLFEEYARIRNSIPSETLQQLLAMEDVVRFGFSAARHIQSMKTPERQALLECDDPRERLERLQAALRGELELLSVDRRRTRPRKPDARAIEPDLSSPVNERDEFRAELQELEQKIIDKELPSEALERAQKELRKLRLMSPMSAEATVVRNYLDWILSMPWGPPPWVALDLERAAEVLDTEHRGLHRVKQRILEYVAVMKRLDEIGRRLEGPLLCLVGPPGVGKTSLARSIATATGRPFVRIALGGVRDEAEIRGHRRTYIGAMPGRIIQGVRKAGSTGPVFLLDEIDKLSSDFRGDPASALLEVLDPEQNRAFTDHYLDLDYDLSNVLFICTANNLDGIPVPLQDRLEIVRLSGYTGAEKESIARHHLIPRQMHAHGIDEKDLVIPTAALRHLIEGYTREAGVRNLDREIATICRKVARRATAREERLKKENEQKREAGVTEGFANPYLSRTVHLGSAHIGKMLGPPRHRSARISPEDGCGFVNGLAWTAVGGVIVPIEAIALPGTGKITLTGKLGEVFRESAQAAITWMRSRADSLGLARDFWEHTDLHVHIPELWGVDGPSAGITLVTAIISAVCRLPVRRDVAMTGEISLRGQVRPIGGLKEKLLAAQQAGVRCVLIPADNTRDLPEVPRSTREALDIRPVSHMDEVLAAALVRTEKAAGEPAAVQEAGEPH